MIRCHPNPDPHTNPNRRSPIVINRVCIPQSRATCQPIIAHYREAIHNVKRTGFRV